MRVVIFANGSFNDPEYARSAIRADDVLIAADGGLHHCLALGLKPAILIGDFDSLEAEEIESLRRSRVEIIRHSTRKDFTDLELALRHARSLDAEEVLILAALGARWDQTLANLLLPACSDFIDLRIVLLDGHQEMHLLRGGAVGNRLEINSEPGSLVSLVPLAGEAYGVTTLGLEYPLNDETLFFGSTRGVSNVLVEQQAYVSLRRGMLMCIVNHLPIS